jgi:hypothetical protein
MDRGGCNRGGCLYGCWNLSYDNPAVVHFGSLRTLSGQHPRIVAAAGGEPKPPAAAGDADRRQALADERASGDEGDPGRRAGRLATEGAVDPGKCPLTKIDKG